MSFPRKWESIFDSSVDSRLRGNDIPNTYLFINGDRLCNKRAARGGLIPQPADGCPAQHCTDPKEVPILNTRFPATGTDEHQEVES